MGKKGLCPQKNTAINKKVLIHNDVIFSLLLFGAVNCVYLYLILMGFVLWNLPTMLKRKHWSAVEIPLFHPVLIDFRKLFSETAVGVGWHYQEENVASYSLYSSALNNEITLGVYVNRI